MCSLFSQNRPHKRINRKGTEEMAKSALKNFSAEKLTHAIDQYKHDNPVLVRKKFQMKDTWFRRDQPDVEVFHIDVGFDVEMYVILLLIAAAAVFLICKIGCALSNMRIRRRHRKD